MATAKRQHTPEALGILNDEALAGAGAATLMRTLGPVIAARLEYFLQALEDAPADLGTLLDLRAKIATIRNLQREFRNQMLRGGEAAVELEAQYRQ